MKTKHLFEEFNDQMRSWENQNQYPSQWDDEEFEPTENGFETFADTWEELDQAARTGSGAALVKIARNGGTTPQKVYQEIRKIRKMAQEEAGAGADELFYTDEVASNAIKALQQGDAKMFWHAMSSLGEDVLDYEAAEKQAQRNRADNVDSPD